MMETARANSVANNQACGHPASSNHAPLGRTLLLALALFSGLVGLARGELPPLETVAKVDLERYQGVWYEVAKLPNRFQDHCVGEVTATYSQREDGDIEVVNRCRNQQGEMDEAIGVARVVNPPANSQLEVSFVSLFGFNLFWGDYWIINLDPDYRHVVIATPSRKYAWILARTPTLSQQTRAELDQVLEQAGYTPEELMDTNNNE
jgi:apolipoprotein D and lipocalin family protein